MYTNYIKLCSVESKLVYFSQFWVGYGMRHFLGPVCDVYQFIKMWYQIIQFAIHIIFMSPSDFEKWNRNITCLFMVHVKLCYTHSSEPE